MNTSRRPYLLRAMHEWMTDNGLTPLIVADAVRDDVQVPSGHVSEGRIVLNVSWSATRELQLGNESVSFGARFGGTPFQVELPVSAVLGIYARESGQGMIFGDSDSDSDGDPPPEGGPDGPAGERDSPGDQPAASRSHLKVVK